MNPPGGIADTSFAFAAPAMAMRRRWVFPIGWMRPGTGLVGLAVAFLIWWLATDLFVPSNGLVHRFSPLSAFSALTALIFHSDLLEHVLVSLRRVLVGLLGALVIGVPFGLALGRLRWLERAASPALQFLRMVSPLSWMPLAVMLFGIGDRPIHVLLILSAVWPVMLSTAAGVRQIDPAWLQLSRSLAATRSETLLRVILPGVFDHVLTGLRLAIGTSWIVLVPCEMLGVSAGLGYVILDTRDRLAYDELMAVVLLIGMLGFALDALARGLHRFMTHHSIAAA